MESLFDRHDIYFVVRFFSMGLIGLIIGFSDPVKLLGVVSCILAWQYVTVREANEDKRAALDRLREELVKDQYGSKL
jgi:hypothetical protein